MVLAGAAADTAGTAAAGHRGHRARQSRAVGLASKGRGENCRAAMAASNQLPLYTANPDDFKGVEGFVEVVGIQARPNSL